MDDPVPSTSSTSKKRKKESAPNEDDPHPKRIQPDSNSKTDIVASSAGLKNSLHGNIFQLKLLNLCLLQGLDAGYDFLLATERPDLGDKFDDLVFKFWPNTSKRSEFKIRFVQAKHKQSDSETIKASHLLNCTEGEFSLVKYFLSFRHIYKKYSSNLHDVVICSNAGLDEDSLNSKGFSLMPHQNSDENIFTFGTLHHIQLQNHSTANPHELWVKLKQSSTTHLLANYIIKCFSSNDMKMTLHNPWFKLYHFALIKERVLVVNRKAKEFLAEFHFDFKENRNNLSPRALELRDILCKDKTMWETLKVAKCQTSSTFGSETAEAHPSLPCDPDVTDSEIDEFFKKLVFAKVPNEVELGKILTASVGKRYGLNNSSLQSAFILTEILNWFKTKESKFMQAEAGLKILKENEEKIKALQYTWSSLHYQEIVTEDGFSFSPEAIQQTVARLKTFLDSSDADCQELQIFTLSCRLSCIKLHFALRCFSEFEPRDSYWMLQYSDLKAETNLTLLKNMMKSTDSPKLLIIVCDDTVPPPYLKASDIVQKQQKMILLIEGEAISEGVSEKKGKVEKEEINFRDLSEESQILLLNVSVNFQGEKTLNVETLIQSDDPSQVIDSISLFQLYLHHTKRIGVGVGVAPPVSQYDECLYINRRLVFPLTLTQFESCVRCIPGFEEKFRLSRDGNIEWVTTEFEEKRSLWGELKKKVERLSADKPVSEKFIISENEVFRKWTSSKIVIVSDIPGMGKSVLLTHLYEQIKIFQAHAWIVRINLIDYARVLYKVNEDLLDHVNSATDFLINSLMEPSLKKNNFAKTLFRLRLLETGGVVLMLDGFDEIQDICQLNAIRLMKTLLNQTNTDCIYVTTRPHMKDYLEDHFFQFAILLEEFNKEDQENCLRKYWEKQFKQINNIAGLKSKEVRIARFAEKVVEFAGNKLSDKERSFSGVPLHCRMLAECFETNLIEGLQSDQEITVHSPFEVSFTFNLASLYRFFFQTKWDILQEEKKKTDPINFFINATVEKELYEHFSFFQSLSIKTLLPNKEDADALWNNFLPKKLLQLCSESSSNFGLTEQTANNELRFFHRTFAEFFIAYHVITIFETEDISTPNDPRAQDVIIKKILNDNLFRGVRSFLDSMMENIMPSARISWPFDEKKPIPLLLRESFNCRFVLSQLCSTKVNFLAYPNLMDLSDDFVVYEEVYSGDNLVLSGNRKVITSRKSKELPIVSSSKEGTGNFTEQVLYRVTQEGHANILGWLLYCAKESILRQSGELGLNRWTDEMRLFLDPSKVCLALGFKNIENFGCIFERYLMWYIDSCDQRVLTDLIDNILLALSKSVFHFDFSHHRRASEAELLISFMKHHRNTLGSQYFHKLKEADDEPFILATLILAFRISIGIDNLKQAKVCETVLTRLADIFENLPGAFAKILNRWFLRSYKCPLSQGTRACDLMHRITPSILEHYSSSVVLHTIGHLSILPLDQEAREFLNSKIVKQIIGLALRIDPLAIFRLGTTVSNNIELGAYGLSPLQIAAMHGDIHTIQNILKNCESNEEALARDLTQNEYGIPPLYLAASCSHEEACKVIMAFLKATPYFFQSIEELIASKDNSFYSVLFDAAGRIAERESIILCFLNVVEATYSSEDVFKVLTHCRVRESGHDITILKLAARYEMYHVIYRIIEISSNHQYFSDLIFMDVKHNLFFNLTFPRLPTTNNVSFIIAEKCEEDKNSQISCLKKALENILFWKTENELLDSLFMNRSGGASIDQVVIIFCSSIVQDFSVQKLFGPTVFSHFVQLLTASREYLSGISSVWTEYCTQPGTSVTFIDQILIQISKGFGNKCVIDMIFHNDGKGRVIDLAKKFGRDDVVRLMRKHLVKENYNALTEMDDRLGNIVREKNERHDWLPR
jgi:hypothetical protein